MRRTCAGLFLLALATLLVEVLLTRVFDVLLRPNLSFVIISGAIFGLGLGGLYDLLTSAPDRIDGESGLARTTMLFGVSVWILPLLLNEIPFSIDRVSTEPVKQLAWFLALYLALLAPFFFAGLSICRIFAHRARDIQRLYFWDLSGAALGSAILIPLLPPLGPPRLLLLAALLALTAAALFAGSRRWRVLLLAAAVLLAVVPALLGGRYLTLALHDDKRGLQSAVAAGRLEVSRWDPVSQISVVDQPAATSSPADRGRKHIAYDGGSQSSDFFPFDGNFAALRRDLPTRMMYQFWQRGVLASHYLRRDSGHSALIIGSAGGQETKAALMYGAAHVDAVEMVGTVVRLATGRYARYIGHVFEQPGVNLQVGEGRSVLRATSRTYDVIQVFSNYTSSSVAAGSGAFSPEYLQTREAYVEYFSHLKPNGIVHVNHLVYPRVIATAAAAWRALGGDDFRAHVVVFEKQNPIPDLLPTILIKQSPWTPAEVADLSRFFSAPVDGEPAYALVENPFDRPRSFLPDVFYSGELPEALVDASPYDLSVATDDRPFFLYLRRSLRTLRPDRAFGLNFSSAWTINSQLRGGWLPMDWLHLIIASAAGAFYGVLFILVPMFLSRVGRERWPGKGPTMVYFSLLGFAFIDVELVLVQIFMKLIGYPLYSVATVLTVMLIGAAIGSASSKRLAGDGSPRWYLPFAGVVVTGLALWLVYPALFRHAIAAPMPIRIAVAAATIFPLAFFMGMPFPLGILELQDKPRGAVAWAWSMNGLCTTIGSVVTVLLSLWLGFRATLLAALVAYVLASLAFGRLKTGRRLVAAPAQARRGGARAAIL